MMQNENFEQNLVKAAAADAKILEEIAKIELETAAKEQNIEKLKNAVSERTSQLFHLEVLEMNSDLTYEFYREKCKKSSPTSKESRLESPTPINRSQLIQKRDQLSADIENLSKKIREKLSQI